MDKVKMRIPKEHMAYCNKLRLAGEEDIIPQICYWIQWRGKIIKSAKYSGELEEIEFVPTLRLQRLLNRIYDMVDFGYYSEDLINEMFD